MNKFKTGDKIVRVSNGSSYNFTLPIGFKATVIEGYKYKDQELLSKGIINDLWELAEDTSKHHVHHDLIIAWAKGAKIEYDSASLLVWKLIDKPGWHKDMRYRVRPPPPKTDKERIVELEARVTELEDNQ